MPVHNWANVADGTYHAFHGYWVHEIAPTLNEGVLPPGYEAMPEQIFSGMHPDVLTLRLARPASGAGGVLLADAPPAARLRARPGQRPQAGAHPRRPGIAIREVRGRQIVAIIEVVSPGNKDRVDNVQRLAEKAVNCIESGIHVMLLDVLPRTARDPNGVHGAVWGFYDSVPFVPPPEPLLLASYIGRPGDPEAFLEPCAPGQPLRPLPLFLTTERYVEVPLEETYMRSFRRLGASFREEVESA